MTAGTLMLKSAFRNTRRTGLTALSLAVSLALIMVLQTILAEITKPTGLNESVPRVVIRHRVSLTLALPRPYEQKIRKVPGIVDISPMQWFGGIWKDDDFRNFFPRFGVDPDHFFNVFLDYKLGPGQLEAFQKTRNGCLVGTKLVERYGFKVGDNITIKGDIFPVDLQMKVVGIITGTQPDWLVFQIKYLDELLGQTTRTGTFFALADSPERVETLVPQIEEMFRNSDAQVKAETEKAFQLSFVEMLGNIKFFINGIVTVVIFAVLMIAASTMALAIRERTREIATLKAIGFTRLQVLGLVVGEGMIVSSFGGGLGVFLSWLMLPSPRWFVAVAAGTVVAVLIGLFIMVAGFFLPEGADHGYRLRLARLRGFIETYGPRFAILSGAFIMLFMLLVTPPVDWFTMTGGMIQSMVVRNETVMSGIKITLFIGALSSTWPAWQASRMSVLDGLRTLE